jgi:hypothetical protein
MQDYNRKAQWNKRLSPKFWIFLTADRNLGHIAETVVLAEQPKEVC